MKKFFQVLVTITVALSFAGCSSFKFPGVYRVVIQQGNYIEEKMVEQLEVGMNKRQVRYIMGTPLIQDTFNTNRWDYYYTTKRGDKTYKEHHFSVFFEGDKLIHWEGDYEPEKKVKQAKKDVQKEASDTPSETPASKVKS